LLLELKRELLDAWAGADACTAKRAAAVATAAVTTDLFTRASKSVVAKALEGACGRESALGASRVTEAGPAGMSAVPIGRFAEVHRREVTGVVARVG
jgi:hypothetical protein